MNNQQVLHEIAEANLTYLMLAQQLIREDRESARSRLGIGEESAGIIEALTPPQLTRLARGNLLLCRFHATDEVVWELLTHQSVPARFAADAHAPLRSPLALGDPFAPTEF